MSIYYHIPLEENNQVFFFNYIICKFLKRGIIEILAVTTKKLLISPQKIELAGLMKIKLFLSVSLSSKKGYFLMYCISFQEESDVKTHSDICGY